MDKPNKLVIPSCSGVLDCFNTRLTRYYKKESMCCLQGEANNLLLLGLFSYIYQNTNRGSETYIYTFKMADFKKFIGYADGGKSQDLNQLLLDLQCVGYLWEYAQFDKVLQVTFSGRTVTIESEYFQKIFQHMRSVSAKYDKWGRKVEEGKSTYSSLVHTSILKERNTGSVEIAIKLCKLIERRGPLQSDECAHISITGLIDRCPSLSLRLEAVKEVKEQNRIVKTGFDKALELLKSKTDIYQSFSDLAIVLPDKITISKDKIIKITYVGRII